MQKSRRLTKSRSEQARQPAGGNLKRLAVLGGAIKDLLDVDIHLSKERRRDRVTVALVSQDGHPIPNFSIQVELQHAKRQIWMRLEGALSKKDAERLGQRLRDSLARSRNRLVLDLNKLHWHKTDDLHPLCETLAAYRSRLRVVLPKLSAAHPEVLLIASMFHHY